MINWPIIGATLLPNVGGWVGALTMSGQVIQPDGKAWYQTINKPSWNPPNWVFGPTWTALYAGMGYASYLVYRDCDGFTENAVVPLSLYAGQLALNWVWSPIFFRAHKIGLALIDLVILDAVVIACAYKFYEVNTYSGYLMLPYIGWIGFATCLNYSIWRKNQSSPKIKEIKDD